MALGARIKQARFAAGMTQAALARATGVSERNIVRWENDQHAPRFDHVERIAEATDCDISFFTAPAGDSSESGSESDDEEGDPMADLMSAIKRLARAEAADIVRAELAKEPRS